MARATARLAAVASVARHRSRRKEEAVAEDLVSESIMMRTVSIVRRAVEIRRFCLDRVRGSAGVEEKTAVELLSEAIVAAPDRRKGVATITTARGVLEDRRAATEAEEGAASFSRRLGWIRPVAMAGMFENTTVLLRIVRGQEVANPGAGFVGAGVDHAVSGAALRAGIGTRTVGINRDHGRVGLEGLPHLMERHRRMIQERR